MRPHVVVAVVFTAVASAQQTPATDSERVAGLLRQGDPLVDGKLGSELLGSGALDDAIRAVARSEAMERVVRLRALRLVRALDLAAGIRASARHDLAWWLALHEIRREVPEAVAAALVKRAFADASVGSAASKELDATTEVANRFCTEWNETRDANNAAIAAKYDALEAELKKSAPAVVPAMFSLLSVPPSTAFSGPRDGQPVTARQQVRAILGLASVLELDAALPFFVMHTAGPSLTQSSNAALAVQRFSGESFGASFMAEGDEAALLDWWRKHSAEHRVVLDYIHHRTLQWARAAIESTPRSAADSAWGAITSLLRAVGDARDVRLEGSVEAMRARLDEIELAWLLAPR